MPFVKYFNSDDFLCKSHLFPTSKDKFLRNPGATTDIAIWSTVEQGLAITAGSLATLRPLLYLAFRKLGITTRNTGQSPSGYGLSGPSKPFRSPISNERAEKSRSDVFKHSTTIQSRVSDDGHAPRLTERAASPKWYRGSFAPRQGPKESRRNTTDVDNESEQSLKIKSSRSSEEGEGMNIMVSKSFYITDEESGAVGPRREPR